MAKKKKTIKETASQWKSSLQEAYNIGFNDGYNSFAVMPKAKGAIAVAMTGYENGAVAHKRKLKYNQKIKKINEKQGRASAQIRVKKVGKSNGKKERYC